MKQSDLVRLSVKDGSRVEGHAPTDASASSIHSQIYNTRGRGGEGGVEAIVHVHGPHSKAFSALGRELEMINQDVCAYHDEQVLVPFGGMSTQFRAGAAGLMIGAVFDNKEGERIAKVMGNKTIGILQNHGTISLGKMSIDEAAWW